MLGEVNASPEFSFPLQLVYLSSRQKQGLFGAQWFCPQLESSLLPVGIGYLRWVTPGNDTIIFGADKDNKGDYISGDRQWRAKASRLRQVLRSRDGWTYNYSKGRLSSVVSPSGRVLEFAWDRTGLQAIQLRDETGGARLPILNAVYGTHDKLTSLKISGKTQSFKYEQRGSDEYLTLWQPVIGDVMKFRYRPEGAVLQGIGRGDTKEADNIEVIKTVYVKPTDEQKREQEASSDKNPANYWLSKDSIGSYTFGRTGKQDKEWDPGVVSVAAHTGGKRDSNFSPERGIVTSKQGTMERKEYYYRSPGKKYDGKLRRVTLADKIIQEYRYDRRTGLLIESIDARGKITFYDYDPKNRPSKSDDWEPKPVRVRYGTRNSSEVVAEYSYSDDGKVSAVKDSLGRITKYTYTPKGELAAVQNATGETVSYKYDKLGRLVNSTSPSGSSTVEYDEFGRVLSQADGEGRVTSIAYDENGLAKSISSNGSVAKEFVRDATNQVIGEKDGLGRVSAVERDFKGNLISQTSPNGAVTRYEYDSLGRRTAQIDGNGNRIAFEYDSAGHLTRQTNPLENFQHWVYDENTGLQIGRDNGVQQINQTYDEFGQLSRIDYGDGEKIAFRYDDRGRQIAAASPVSSLEYEFDKAGRISAIESIHENEKYLTEFRYNMRDQREAMLISKRSGLGTGAYLAIQQTDTEYDANGFLSAIYTNGLQVIAYVNDKKGRPIRKTFGTGTSSAPALTVEIAYDSMGRMAKMEFAGGRLTSPLALIYDWDAADQLSSRTWNGVKLDYGYDPAGQLLSVTDSGEKELIEAYRYDPAGNMRARFAHRALTVMTYNAANHLERSYNLPAALDIDDALALSVAELEKAATKTITHLYDKAGRLLGDDPKNPTRYGWLDKLVEAPLPGGGKVRHEYWPDGHIASVTNVPGSIRPVSTLQAPAKETFLWDGLALIKRNDTIYIIEPHPSGGIPIASHPVERPDQITYHLNDMLGTTLATVGPAGIHFTALSSFGAPQARLETNIPTTQGPTAPTTRPTEPSRLPPSQ